MSVWSEVHHRALNVEEAALLPARNRSIAGRSALQDALRRAEQIGEKQVSNTVQAGEEAQNPGNHEAGPVYRFPGSRAALHQVRPNW